MKVLSRSLTIFALLAVGIMSSQAQIGVFDASQDIFGGDGSNLGADGSASFDPATGTYTVEGSGDDIWNAEDNFHYLFTTWSGDFDVQARITISQGTSDWTKSMIMARATLDAGSINVGTRVRGADGQFSMQRRFSATEWDSTPGDLRVVGINGGLQRLVKRGNTFSTYYMDESTGEWVFVHSQELDLPETFYLGFAVTAHTVGEIATGTFSEVAIIPGDQFTNATTWNGGLGAAPLPGSARLIDDAYILTGNGRDIWNEADDGYFLFTELAGDGAISAKVRWIDGGLNNDWSKAGIMIRDDGADPASAHYWIELRSGPDTDGIALGDRTDAQWRDDAGASSGNAEITQADGSAVASPDGVWYRVSRRGNEFTSSYSLDGSTWAIANTHTANFTDNVAAYGLVVTSHTEDDEIVTAEFTDVSVGTSGLQTSSVGDEWSLYE